jgi:hypothetical protein
VEFLSCLPARDRALCASDISAGSLFRNGR